jgi:hypothetical protein
MLFMAKKKHNTTGIGLSISSYTSSNWPAEKSRTEEIYFESINLIESSLKKNKFEVEKIEEKSTKNILPHITNLNLVKRDIPVRVKRDKYYIYVIAGNIIDVNQIFFDQHLKGILEDSLAKVIEKYPKIDVVRYG